MDSRWQHALLERLGRVTVVPALAERAPLPVWFLPCFFFAILFSIALPRGLLRTAFTLPVIAYLTWKYGQYTFGEAFPDRYPFGCLVVANLFKYIDFVLLGNADRETIRPKGSTYAAGIGSPPPPLTTFPRNFRERFVWAFKLVWVYQRGYGWTHQVKSIPAPESKGIGRWNFVAQQISRACFSLLVINAVKAYMASTRFGSNDALPRSYFFSEPLWYQFFMSFCVLWFTWAPFTLQASAIYSLAVALGIWRPEDCPPIWGPWSESYTVRKLWGTTWHQCLRRIANSSGRFVAKDFLRLKRGSFASKYTQLFVGFLASAMIHSGAAIYTVGHDTGDIKYFMAQPAIILIEDHVIAAGRKLGIKEHPAWKHAGYLWAWTWLFFSMRWWCGPQLEEGLVNFPKTNNPLGFLVDRTRG
ncbi:membrane bound O-acyl transferase family-domain-containing protein [Phyllosticta capitalensis]|uniref:Membrane bound O-acyl transferase family-domain-containing protein n=1 Tax=Phyllosticta capitalensis TaxID=121624 RepID=A0ABR1YLW8_9PEZI